MHTIYRFQERLRLARKPSKYTTHFIQNSLSQHQNWDPTNDIGVGRQISQHTANTFDLEWQFLSSLGEHSLLAQLFKTV